MSFGETIFLFVLALVVFGPKKLPEIARQVGKYLNEFRRASNEFKAQIEQEITHLEREETRKILPPTEPPSGAASRDLTSGDPAHTAAEPPATLAASTTADSSTEQAVDSTTTSTVSATAATEAGPPAGVDETVAPASQESHA